MACLALDICRVGAIRITKHCKAKAHGHWKPGKYDAEAHLMTSFTTGIIGSTMATMNTGNVNVTLIVRREYLGQKVGQ